jgi:hypothetical protein
MKILTEIKFYLVVVILSFFGLLVNYLYLKDRLNNVNKELGECKKSNSILEHNVDSLIMENYPCQIEIGRYQMAYEILLERNPSAAKQYGDIISNETE